LLKQKRNRIDRIDRIKEMMKDEGGMMKDE
jgi:hypothetical protein